MSKYTNHQVDLVAEPENIQVVSSGPEGAVTLVALGPGLASMDSGDVKSNLACTQNGIALTATITRSADFHGFVAQNFIWRPRFTIVLALRKPEIVVQAVWRMRLSTGAEQTHAWSPPFPDRKYPITVTETVRSSSSPAADGQGSPIKIEIKPAQTAVKNNEDFSVDITIRNTSSVEQLLEVMSCSYSMQWTLDNPSVRLVREACEKNIPIKISLKPGQAFERAVLARVVLASGNGQSESVTFRLGFIGAASKPPPIWSNHVTVSVTR
jgi:hypothetical protein